MRIEKATISTPEPAGNLPDQADYSVAVIATAPDATMSQQSEQDENPAHTLLEWPQTVKNRIQRVSVAKSIREVMDRRPDLTNWVKTCLAQHVMNEPKFGESVCYVPDPFREMVGEKITILSTNGIPGRYGLEHSDGIFHIMINL